MITSCDPCDDCDSVTFEPTVSFVFINQDSVARLDTLISINGLKKDTVDLIIATLDATEEVKLDSLNGVKTSLDSATSAYAGIQALINTGSLRVEQVAILGANSTLTFEDSATSWLIPLSYNQSFNQYEVSIAGVSEVIELSYDIFQELDEERNVLIRAENIRVSNTPYDSLVNCEENCVDGETTFTFYF